MAHLISHATISTSRNINIILKNIAFWALTCAKNNLIMSFDELIDDYMTKMIFKCWVEFQTAYYLSLSYERFYSRKNNSTM